MNEFNFQFSSFFSCLKHCVCVVCIACLQILPTILPLNSTNPLFTNIKHRKCRNSFFFFGGKTPIENDMNETNLCESFSAIYKTRRPHHLSLHVDNFLLHQFYALKQFFHILLFWNLHISLILFPCFFSSLVGGGGYVVILHQEKKNISQIFGAFYIVSEIKFMISLILLLLKMWFLSSFFFFFTFTFSGFTNSAFRVAWVFYI